MEESVRKAESDFTNTYLRPMPGADRMYPETDIRSIKVTKGLLDSIELPELLDDKAKKLEKYSLDKELAKKIAKQDKVDFFEDLFKKLKNLKPSFVVDTFASIRKQLNKEFKIEEQKISDENITKVLELINDSKLSNNNLAEALVDIVNDDFNPEKYKATSDNDLEKEIEKIVKSKPGLNPGAYMGLVMAKFQGKIDGKKAMEILKKYL